MSIRIIISTLGVIIQLGLTILAWGDWNSYFSPPAPYLAKDSSPGAICGLIAHQIAFNE